MRKFHFSMLLGNQQVLAMSHEKVRPPLKPQLLLHLHVCMDKTKEKYHLHQ